MSINEPMIGDLICYNAGGMKYKTLGLVLDHDFVGGPIYGRKSYLIQWSVVGDFMPRRMNVQGNNDKWGIPVAVGEIAWFEAGGWFEVSK